MSWVVAEQQRLIAHVKEQYYSLASQAAWYASMGPMSSESLLGINDKLSGFACTRKSFARMRPGL